MGSFAPYGYKRDEEGHKLIIDPVAAEVVRKIFDMYANGYGYHKICVYLNVLHYLPSITEADGHHFLDLPLSVT